MNKWVTVEAERVLYVHYGRDVILCDDHWPGRRTIVLQFSPDQQRRLLEKLNEGYE